MPFEYTCKYCWNTSSKAETRPTEDKIWLQPFNQKWVWSCARFGIAPAGAGVRLQGDGPWLSWASEAASPVSCIGDETLSCRGEHLCKNGVPPVPLTEQRQYCTPGSPRHKKWEHRGETGRLHAAQGTARSPQNGFREPGGHGRHLDPPRQAVGL